MDQDRLKKALPAFRKNLRTALAASGVQREFGKLQLPPAGIDLFEGVDATPEELVCLLDHRAVKATQMLSVMNRMAAVGFAVEMGMHEVNTEMYSALSSIGSAKQYPENAKRHLDGATESLERLSGSLTVFSTMQQARQRHGVTGREALDTIMSIYGHYTTREKVTVEATDAFLAADIGGNARDTMPAILNIFRNAWGWTLKSDRPRHIRLDAETVPMETRDFGSEDESATRIEDVVVISIEDSGPGVPADVVLIVARN